MHAQIVNMPKPYIASTVEHIGPENGLSQGFVSTLGIDSIGYLWLSTKEGLHRYDGTEFKVYKHDDSDSTSIRSNNIGQLLIDSKNNLWVADEFGNLDFFDRQTETFIHIKHDIDVVEYNNNKGTLNEDMYGNIIVGAGSIYHAVKKEGAKKEFVIKRLEDVYPCLKSFFLKNLQGSIHFTNSGMLAYINYEITRLYLFTKPLQKHIDPLIYDIEYKKVLLSKDLNEGLSNKIFLLDANGDLSEFNQDNEKFDLVLSLKKSCNQAYSYIDNDKLLWIFQDKEHCLRVNLNNKKVDSVRLNYNQSNSIASEHAYCFEKDKNGNIWIGTNGHGLLKIATKSTLFNIVEYLTMTKTSEPIYVYRAATKNSGKIFDWSITNKWLDCINKCTKQVWDPIPVYPSNLAYDSSGFFYTHSRIENIDYLFKVNPQTCFAKILISKKIDRSNNFGFPIILDNADNIWIGESYSEDGHIIYRIDNKTNNITKYSFPVEQKISEYRFISDWHQEADNIFWFATRQGVFSFNPDSEVWHSFVHIEGDSNSLSNNLTLSLCADPENPDRYLWIGTEGGGLNKLDKTTGRCKRFTIKEGLPNNVVYGILDDDYNNLWLSTNNGLCLFNTQTYQTSNFDAGDGLPGNEFNRHEYGKEVNGQLHFMGVNGGVLFNPDDYYKRKHESKTIINKVKILNKEVFYHALPALNKGKVYVLPAPIESCKELRFDYKDRMITLGFSVLDFTNPRKNRYRYILEGFHDTWIDAGTSHEATFTNLDPGSYTLKVIGQNSDNVWSKDPAIIKITILPPWWATWWFRLLILLVVSGILYLIYRFRLKQILAVERVRNDIAQDLHDEIGSSLSSISLYATVMEKTENTLSSKGKLLLDKVLKSSSEMMESMNDIVWATKTDNDDFQNVINRMRAFAVSTTEAKGIVLYFNKEFETARLKLSMPQRKNVYMLFKEAINNAIKHSGCSAIHVTINVTHSKLELKIEDDGLGFDKESALEANDALGGNGLKGMIFRAEQIGAVLSVDSIEGSGTSILLTLMFK